MNDERTLDEALDEIDRWGDEVSCAIEGLSSQEVVEYFQGSLAQLEQLTGKRLKFALPKKPPTAAV